MEPSSSQSGGLIRRMTGMVNSRRKNTHPYKHHPAGFHSGENLARRRSKPANMIQDYTQHNIRAPPHGACPCFSPYSTSATAQHGGNHVHNHPGPCHYQPHNNHQYQQPGTISLGYGMPAVSPASVVQPRAPPGFQPPHVDPRSVVPRPDYPPGPPFDRFRGQQPRRAVHSSHRYVDDPEYDEIYPNGGDDDDDDMWPRSPGSPYSPFTRQPIFDDGLIPIMDSDFDDSLSYRRERRSRDEPAWSSYR